MSEAAAPQPSLESGGGGDAPPKQVAMAMERLGTVGRLIADIRLGADRILEALFVAKDLSPSRAAAFLVAEEDAMRRHFKDLRDMGRQLEETGVLNVALKSRGNSWGLHMPLVCPDGAVVAYAWKRQLAGQAGASAVDRTRLALNAFTDQKRRFFPHLEEESHSQPDGGVHGLKRHCGIQRLTRGHQGVEETLSDILKNIEQEVPSIKIFTYQRADWLERAASLHSVENYSVANPSQERNIHDGSRTKNVSAAVEQVAVIELLVPLVFRAVISLHPAGSVNPDAVAFFSPSEGGNYIHARGVSVHHVFRHVTEHGDKALQFFLSVYPSNALSLLLRWIISYQALFTKTCSKCKRLLVTNKSQVLLPPVCRPFVSVPPPDYGSRQGWSSLPVPAYHIGCSPHAM